jgi:hypothetical protein
VSFESSSLTSDSFKDPPRVKPRWFVDRVAKGEPFAFTRWGDSEWLAVLEAGAGDRQQDFLPEMCTAIRGVLMSRPSYMLGMQPYAMRIHGGLITPFVERHGLRDLDWIWSDVFHRANIHGRLARLTTELRKAPLIFVGPAHLRPVSDALDAHRFVEVPSFNAYLEFERAHQEALLALETAPAPTFVSVSMGIAANILIDRLYKRFPGHMFCDMGSIWDVHVGIKSRAYMHKVEIPEIPTLGLD